jgi:hypothetical protein
MKESCETEAKPKSFNNLIRSGYFWKPVSAALAGGLIGYLYYNYVGCASGTCAITSNPFTSVIFGAVLGLFIVNRPCKTC